jgi:hypothetical protein
MSNSNNSSIRIDINEQDYEYANILSMIRYRQNNQHQQYDGYDDPFSRHVFNISDIMNPEDEIRYALDQVNMLNVMSPFFNADISNQFVYNFSMRDMDENSRMEIAQRESLDHYKTQEKKPYIKLCVDEKTVSNNMVDKKDMCAICVSAFEFGEKITEVKCNHSFHTSCLSEWVKYKSNCPVCRHVVKTVDEPPVADRDEA